MSRLISTVGKRSADLDERSYTLGEKTCRSIHSSFALSTLLSNTDQFSCTDDVLFLIPSSITDVVKEQLREEGEQLGFDQITFTSTQAINVDSSTRIRQVIEWAQPTDCIVDLTGMPPELVGMISCYVCALQQSNSPDEPPALFVGQSTDEIEEICFSNLSDLVHLPGWNDSFDVLMQYLEGSPLADRLDALHNASYKDEDRPESSRLQQLGKMVSGSTHNLTAALPLEAGISGAGRRESFWQEVIEDAKRLNPYIQQILPEIRNHFRQIGVEKGRTEKTNIKLTEDELKRQYRCAKRLVRSKKLLPAYLLARELLVNGALLGTSTSVSPDIWLDGDTRDHAAAPFYLLNHWNQYEELRELPYEHQQRISRLWGAIKSRRNKLAHAGFNNEPIRFDRLQNSIKKNLEKIRTLILDQRNRLENLLDFPFDDHLFLFAPGKRAPEACHEFRLLQNELDGVSSLIILIDEQQDPAVFQNHCKKQFGEQISVTCWRFPGQEGQFEYGQEAWEANRRTLLQNQSVTLSVTQGHASTQHAIRQLYDQISRFGIGTKLVGYDRADLQGEEYGLVTIDSNWMS